MNQPFLYDKLGYVILGTTDIKRAQTFYTDILGLELSSNDNSSRLSFRCSDSATNLALYQRDKAGLISIGMQLQSAQEMEKARQHFIQLGLKVTDIKESERDFLQIGEAFRVFEKNCGVAFDYFCAMTIPGRSFSAPLTKIERIGHIVIRTPKFDEVWQNLSENFGFVASDYVKDKGVWMRCYPNPLHHSLAVIKDEQEGLHHVNFMVTEIDDIGQARNRMIDNNVKIVFGPGRHKPSGSIFLYFTDPDGMTLEYSFGMEEFPVENPREPRMLMNSLDVMDMWGGKPDPAFAAGGDIIEP